MNRIIVLIIFVAFITFACSYHKEANKQAVENLNNQFKQEKYDEMYQQSSNILKNSISENEFISIAKEMKRKMEDVDKNLTWQEDKNAIFDEGVYHDDNFSYRIMLKDGKELHIQINWNEPFQLCSLDVFPTTDENSGIGFRYCD